jgi:hypothetical protein
MDSQSPCIGNMPEGKVSIKWFGRIAINERNKNEPAIETIFTGKTVGGQVAAIVRWIEVGFIPYLHIGSLWETGKYVGCKDYAKRKYTVNFKQNCKIIEAGYKIIDEKYLIPPFRYKIGENWLQSKCVLLDCEQCKIIIPCMEVLRFYYAQSSSVARLLFSGYFSKELICNPANSQIENGNAYLQLRRTIPDIVAPVIGRLVFSEYAMVCAQNIHKSILKSKLKNEDAWPEAVPPLEDNTTIELAGIELNRGAFLGLRILSCDHAFPFKELFYTRDNDGGHLSDNHCERTTTVKNRPSKNFNKKYMNKYFPPTGAKSRIYQVITGRFGYLNNIRVKKIKKNEYILGINKVKSIKWSSQIGSVDKEDKSSDQIELEPLSLKRSKAIPASLESFFSIIENLNLERYLDCEFIALNSDDEDENISTFPIVKGLTRELKWSYMDDRDTKSKRKRKCIVVRIRYYHVSFYAFEAEQKNGKEFHTIFVVHNKDKSIINEVVLEKILEICVKNRGRWLKDGEMDDVAKYKLKHTSSSTSIYANRIKHLITNSVDFKPQYSLF